MNPVELSVPFDRQVWSAERCAAYLEIEKGTFLRSTQFAAGFPKPLEIPGKPRWSALAVSEWALGSRQNHGTRQQVPDSKAA